jgi:hypothetical protein
METVCQIDSDILQIRRKMVGGRTTRTKTSDEPACTAAQSYNEREKEWRGSPTMLYQRDGRFVEAFTAWRRKTQRRERSKQDGSE